MYRLDHSLYIIDNLLLILLLSEDPFSLNLALIDCKFGTSFVIHSVYNLNHFYYSSFGKTELL